MKILYVDVETTGLDPKRNSITQLAGCVVINEPGNTQYEEFDIKMAPYTDAPWDENASMIQGITPEEAAQYPDHREGYLAFTKMLAKYVNRYDRKDKMYICGYNVQFDMDFLKNWFQLNGDPYFHARFFFPPLDVMHLYSWFMIGRRQELPNFRLGTIYQHVMGKELEGAHNALSDILATKELVSALFQKYDFFKEKN